MRKPLAAAGLLAAASLLCITAPPARAESETVPAPTTATCPPLGQLPALRKAGVLTVASPANERKPGGHRLRTHASLDGRVADRNVVWHGPEVPAFVPLGVGKMTLDLLDRTGGVYMALYRDHDLDRPAMDPSCMLSTAVLGTMTRVAFSFNPS